MPIPNEGDMNRLNISLFLIAFCVIGCSQEAQDPNEAAEGEGLIIYCGITMISPVRELMEIFEQKTGVKSVMSYGGSKDLINSLMVNKVGDLYFPGSETLLAEAEKTGLLRDRRVVGANQAALFVQKGNPKNIAGDLSELLRPDVRVAIGHPDLGSIGQETRDILTRTGLYDKAVAASAMMMPDSKALAGALREGKVDLVLNWKPVLSSDGNAQFMDALPLPDDDAKRHDLTMAVTAYSRNPETAMRFVALCASPEGQAIFNKYGF